MLKALLALGAELTMATMTYQQVIAARLGINVTDYGCLQVVMGRGAVTAGELAGRLALSAGAVTGVIDRLEAAGLVRRRRDPADRRKVIVTPAEEEVQRRVAPLSASIYAALTDKVRRYEPSDLQLVAEYLADSLETLRSETARLQEERERGEEAGGQASPQG